MISDADKCKIIAAYLEKHLEEERAYQKKAHGIRNYSQNRWAAEHHFSSPSMSQWILGQRLPEPEHIYQMAMEFGEEILDQLGMDSLNRDDFIRYMLKDRPTPEEAKQLLSLYRKIKATRNKLPEAEPQA